MADLINIKFPDGKSTKIEKGLNGHDIAKQISMSLSKAAIAFKVNGEILDLSRTIEDDSEIQILTKENSEALDIIRHDCAHVMAEAVQTLFPGTQVTIGPSIENGFYYDFARKEPFTTNDFKKIEKKMVEIINKNENFVREEWSKDEAIKFFSEKGEKFKVELINDLPKNEIITIYKQGEWLDLCRGPHMPSTKHIGKSFKLMKVAGAYWRGDSSNIMLTRIYGTAWRNDQELKDYLHQLEEAEKRDHRKLGREMDLFHFQEEAPGAVFWHPKGWSLFQSLINYMRDRQDKEDYVETNTPDMMDKSLWETSGHWEKFGENMFTTEAKEEKNICY